MYTGSTEGPRDPTASQQFEEARDKFRSAMTSPDTKLRDHVFEQCGKAFGAKQYQAVCEAGSVLFIHFVRTKPARKFTFHTCPYWLLMGVPMFRLKR